MHKPVIISLGGSIIVPDQIDIDFLLKFRQVILDRIDQYERFIIVTGGGKTCRRYQEAVKAMPGSDHIDLDWIGIRVTHLNGFLVKQLFKDLAHPELIVDREHVKKSKAKIIVAAGDQPGHSTDYDATHLAEMFGADTVINLSNIDYIYDKDPKTHPEAKPYKNLTWDRVLEIVGDKWVPGANAPYDPIASKLSKKLKLKVVVMKGTNLKNFENLLDGEKFEGSVIE